MSIQAPEVASLYIFLELYDRSRNSFNSPEVKRRNKLKNWASLKCMSLGTVSFMYTLTLLTLYRSYVICRRGYEYVKIFHDKRVWQTGGRLYLLCSNGELEARNPASSPFFPVNLKESDAPTALLRFF